MPYIPIITYPTTGTRVISMCPLMVLEAAHKNLDSIFIDADSCGGCYYYRDEDLFWINCGCSPTVILKRSNSVRRGI